MSRKGDWIQTFTGKAMYPLDPRPEEIDILDIAHSLSLKTRFNGMSSQFYSVAEHSVRCGDYLWTKYRDRKLSLAGLMHDASEAYLPDVPRPLKPFLTNFQEIENGILKVIFEKYNLSWPMDPRIKEADNAWLWTEATQLMEPKCLAMWSNRCDPVDSRLLLDFGVDLREPWGFWKSETLFLEYFRR